MPVIAIIFGLAMDLLGIFGFISSGGESYTALIPSIFGSLILACGIIAMIRVEWRKMAMHIAAAVSVVGLIGASIRAVPKLPALMEGQPVEPSSLAIWMQLSFALLCLIFFAYCLRSFVQARLAAKQQTQP